MLFNSIEFFVFLPIVFVLYWYATNHSLRLQNALVLVSSYVFYGWWDWRFLLLIVFSSMADYLVGLGLEATSRTWARRTLLGVSLVFNLGMLGFFKYCNFFIESFAEAYSFFGTHLEPSRLNIILPVGISFYTFQTLSYTIDVYQRKFKPTRDLVAFFAFVSFFPQLVAGPIERASQLLPQFFSRRRFQYAQAVDGMRQALWGLFKKVVIADNCAVHVNTIFSNYPDYSGSTLLLGAVLFAFQIYCDFSGYSDIAIGVSRLFGFHLMRNFAFPYFSRDMAEFWRRWHISLSTWFRDYVYLPLGGSRGSTGMAIRNTLIVFTVSGFWHGANWTFIAWGLLNAIYFIPLLLAKKNRRYLGDVAEGRWFPSPLEALQIARTFLLTCLAWVFFRAPTITDAVQYLAGIFSPSLLSIPQVAPGWLFILLALFVAVEWVQRNKQHALQIDGLEVAFPARWLVYYGVLWTIFFVGGSQQQFIYFQF